MEQHSRGFTSRCSRRAPGPSTGKEEPFRRNPFPLWDPDTARVDRAMANSGASSVLLVRRLGEGELSDHPFCIPLLAELNLLPLISLAHTGTLVSTSMQGSTGKFA